MRNKIFNLFLIKEKIIKMKKKNKFKTIKNKNEKKENYN